MAYVKRKITVEAVVTVEESDDEGVSQAYLELSYLLKDIVRRRLAGRTTLVAIEYPVVSFEARSEEWSQ